MGFSDFFSSVFWTFPSIVLTCILLDLFLSFILPTMLSYFFFFCKFQILLVHCRCTGEQWSFTCCPCILPPAKLNYQFQEIFFVDYLWFSTQTIMSSLNKGSFIFSCPSVSLLTSFFCLFVLGGTVHETESVSHSVVSDSL